MIRIFQSPWFASLAGSLLYLSTTVVLVEPASFDAVVRLRANQKKAADTSWQYRNPEFNQWVEELKREKESIALREQQLRELQTRLNAERLEVNAMTQTVHKMQSEFDRNVVRIKEQEVDNLKRQARVIAAMSAEGASALLNEMPEDDVVRILLMMKPDDASVILDTLSRAGKAQARRAATVTERMRTALPPSAGTKPAPKP